MSQLLHLHPTLPPPPPPPPRTLHASVMYHQGWDPDDDTHNMLRMLQAMPQRFEYPDPTATANNPYIPTLPFPHQLHQQDQHHQQQHQNFTPQQHHASTISQQNRGSHMIQPQSPLSDSSQNDPSQHHQSPKAGSTPSTHRSTPSSDKAHRLRKACDACSVRKVKCDESGPPCKSCAALDIPCTFKRPSRRRGPPNRHAEAFKRQHNAAATTPTTPRETLSTPQESPSTAPEQYQWSAGVELLCPLELAQLLLDDYFVYQHPLQPFPHKNWFRERFEQRLDRTDRYFLALTAGMIGMFVTSFPRKPRKHIRALGLDNLFPSSTGFVQKCLNICSEAKGTGYLEREGLCSTDAAISYCQLLMTGYTYRFREANLYLGECLTILRSLGFHRPANYSTRYDGSDLAPTGFDYVEQEIGKRLYWLVFAAVRSSKALNASLANIALFPPSPRHPHPPLPLEVDDTCITPNYISPQPSDIVPQITAFNINIRAYLTIEPLLAADLAYGIDENYDLQRQRDVLQRCQRGIRALANEVSDPFLVWPGPPSRSPSTLSARSHIKPEPVSHSTSPETLSEVVLSSSFEQGQEAEQKRLIGYEIQKANIHASIISLRSFFTDRYASLYSTCVLQRRWNTQKGLPDDTSMQPLWDDECLQAWATDIKQAREEIANDLLVVLSSIRPVHMEPNSVSFCMKVRQIASTLLPTAGVEVADEGPHDARIEDADAIAQIHEQLSIGANGNAAQCLNTFLEILMELERTGSGRQEDGEDGGDEAEFRRWADLRAYQREFVRRGDMFEN